MSDYGARDVEKLLRLPRRIIRSLVDAGFVTPARGPRNALRFSFQDLIVLRTARALTEAKVPPKRITRSIKELRRHLPDSMPLSGLSICAVGDKVVVREGRARWQADSGQYLLEFDSDASGTIEVIERRRNSRSTSRERSSAPRCERSAPPAVDAQSDFERGLELERKDPNAAAQAYARAIAANQSFADAHVNLGRLLHEHGQFAQAERVYRSAIAACSGEALLQYNLGVLLEDMGRKREAMYAYEGALRVNPDLVDCLHNLALLCTELGEHKDAIRHMAQYRRLTRGRPR